MATIRAYTTIEQSRKLAEILPLESADMLFQLGEDMFADSIRVPLTKEHWEQMIPDINPCWSLAALLGVLPNVIGYYCCKALGWHDYDWYCAYVDEDDKIQNICIADNPVDACYEMILKLKELNLL